jgi:D-alanyl-D-alanine dipeptidase
MTVKIRFQLQFILFAVISFSTSTSVLSQDTILNKYGLWVIKDVKTLGATTRLDSNKRMVDIKTYIPGVLVDLRYATANNFMHARLYPEIKTTYLRLAAVKALQLVQNELNKMGLALKIFDAYRPYSVTEKMWEPIKDDRYVADPSKGSGHNRGAAVDLTIVDLKTGNELNMGTGFDNFSDTAHQVFTSLPNEILQNRTLLKNTMEKNGFRSLDTEWWHYSLPNIKDFELLDIPFKKLKKLNS